MSDEQVHLDENTLRIVACSLEIVALVLIVFGVFFLFKAYRE